MFACGRGHKTIIFSSTKGTRFENSKIPPAQILLLTYSFAHKFSYKETAVQCSIGDHSITDNTICDWFIYCREVYMLSMEMYARGKIGGLNHIVQTDECKIGRQNFQRGRVVEGNLILGMIDMNTKEVHICPNNTTQQ